MPAGSIDIEDVNNFNIIKGNWRDSTNNYINFRKVPQNHSNLAKKVQTRLRILIHKEQCLGKINV